MTFSNNTPNTKTIVAGSILSLCVSQGFGERRNIVNISNNLTLSKYGRKQGNRGTKLYKLDDENMVDRIIKRGTNKENVREDGNIG